MSQSALRVWSTSVFQQSHLSHQKKQNKHTTSVVLIIFPVYHIEFVRRDEIETTRNLCDILAPPVVELNLEIFPIVYRIAWVP